jgi:hypothetical protein
MAGGLAGYKSQVAVRGLPLRLSREEACLALARGWAVIAPAPASAARLVASGPTTTAGNRAGTAAAVVGSKRPREQQAHACAQHGALEDDEEAYADYYASYYAGGGEEEEEEGAQARPRDEEAGEEDGDEDDDDDSAGPRPWTGAVANGDHMDLPTTAAEANALNARAIAGRDRRRDRGVAPPAKGAAGGDAGAGRGWRFPSTPYERLRAAVFADLHDQG